MKTILLSLFMLLCSFRGMTQFPNEKINQYLHSLDTNDRLLGSVSLMQSGKIVYSKILGANKSDKNNKPIFGDNRPLLRIGSITKTYTATLIMQLIEEGLLTLDTKLSIYYPQIQNADKITIRHLLAHRSGLYSFDNDYQLNDPDSWIYRPQTKQQMLERFSQYKPLFEPDEKTAYSNTGYALLGYIVEDITKSTFEEQLQKRICQKIGLSNTYVSDGTTNPKKSEAYSYIKDAGWVPHLSSNMSASAGGGAGAIIATTDDLAQFYTALFGQKLISQVSLNELIKLKAALSSDQFEGGIVGHGHAGSIDAYQSSVEYFSKDSLCVAVVFNGLNYPFADVFFDLIDICHGKNITPPTFYKMELPRASLNELTGKYRMRSGNVVEIKKKDDGLYFVWEVNGYGHLLLCPISTQNFTHDAKGIYIRFGKNKENKTDRLTMFQGKQVIRMTKE